MCGYNNHAKKWKENSESNNTVVDAEMRSQVIQVEKEECRVG